MESMMESMFVVPCGSRPTAQGVERSVAKDAAFLRPDDCALCALTDFRRECPVTVEADSAIDEALGEMNRLGVHALLVTRELCAGIEQQVVGLITGYHIERRRPERRPWEAASGARSRIRVADVMTPWNELSLVSYESLRSLTAYDLHRMFQGTGLTHLLVIEDRGDESAFARGLISRAALTIRLHRARAACAH